MKSLFLENITIVNYKNIESKKFKLDQKINCFIGNNGVGKTNILDSIYHLSSGKSYFNSINSQSIKHNENYMFIEGDFKKDNEIENIICRLKRGKKKTLKNYSLKNSMFDFNVGYIGTAILGICFICLGYFVMYGSGETFSDSAGAFSNQLIEMYTSSLGNWSYYIIGIAAFSTMLSTTITTLDASPRAMSETTKLIFDNQSKSGYLIWLGILAFGTITIFFAFSSPIEFTIGHKLISGSPSKYICVINLCPKLLPNIEK